MTVNLKLLTVQIVGMFVVFALALLLAAGTVAWPAGWAFLVLILVVAIAFRAVQEERTLRAELPGYDEYIAKVKYRLSRMSGSSDTKD